MKLLDPITLQRFVLPRSTDTAPLYFGSRKASTCDRDTVELPDGATVEFDSYFNALFEGPIAELTAVEEVLLRVSVQGAAMLRVVRRAAGGTTTVLEREVAGGERLLLPIALARPGLRGRLAVELSGHGPGARLVEAAWCVDADRALKPVSLDIILCTYRREAELRVTVDTLVRCTALAPHLNRILVVDNAGTLDPGTFADPRVVLLTQGNFGGAGGFTRGLLESLADPRSTHFLFMDDDVEVDAESVVRVVRWFSLMHGEAAIGGSMLDLALKTSLWEAGATRRGPFGVSVNHHKLDLEERASLDGLSEVPQAEWGGWWFWALPKWVPRRLGLPLPLFLHVDDIEYGLRLKANGIPTHCIPGVAVWHQPHYAKPTSWHLYYDIRNWLICHAEHGQYPLWRMLFQLHLNAAREMLRFNYQGAALILEGLRDFRRGPGALEEPQATQRRVLELTERHAPTPTDEPFVDRALPPPSLVPRLLLKLYRFATLTGHWRLWATGEALPRFAVEEWDYRWENAGDDQVALRDWYSRKVRLYPRDPRRFWALAGELVGSAMASAVGLRADSHRWSERLEELTSEEYWRRYLKLPQLRKIAVEPPAAPERIAANSV
jgi:galactofuranosylgalactofuranosylrhamnosyl-N-acetylglucosaminyl-diphospho-decaprenol beta-1,5/1,6-galactofuranosyltransferase